MTLQALLRAVLPLAEVLEKWCSPTPPQAIFRNFPFVSKTILFNLALCACAIPTLIQFRDSFSSLGYQLQPEWEAIVWPWAWLKQFAWCLIPIWFYCTAVLCLLSWKKSQPNATVSQRMQKHKNTPKPKVIMWSEASKVISGRKWKHT